MRWSKYFIPTLKEDPKDAEIVSHKLMVRAGLVQKLAGGLYTYLPLGLRVIKKISEVIRQELDKRGAIEVQMPILQPREIWERSGRWETMGPLMMRFKNREEKEFVLGPTHEEIITGIAAAYIKSYKDLPKNFYQIQTKFRDEIRPRFGVIRAKEFIMKDGYSFHRSDDDAEREYHNMYEAYESIFKRCGIPAKPIEADTGVMGGSGSHEFTVPAPSGEDVIAECGKCGYSANIELAERKPSVGAPCAELLSLAEVDTPGMKKVDELTGFFKRDAERFIKTLIYNVDGQVVAVLISGDIEISEAKLRRSLKAATVELANEETIVKSTGAPLGFAGPVGLKGIRIIADESVRGAVNRITGANKKDMHFKNVCIDRDFSVEGFFDLGQAKDGDLCVRCGERLGLTRGIEVGQVFKLGTKYSAKMGAEYKDEKGDSYPMIMGCYGIGVSRTVAAVIECNNDANGIIWPKEIAPFDVLIIPINYDDLKIKECADGIYEDLQANGLDVLIDDRSETAGKKFKDADLIGIPVKVIVGKKYLENGLVEVKNRADGSAEEVKKEKVYGIVIGTD